tara:strand:+ start:424 stop:1020 length:597 start_codon:yes stop_codon:yes gene_type:complete
MIDWPDDYRKLQLTGLLQRLRDPDDPLWIWDTKFMSEDQIVSYERFDEQKIEIIPFARTGRGDYWAYLADSLPESDIVLCYHDSYEAEYDTVSIQDFIFKRTVEFASVADLSDNLEDSGWTPDTAKQDVSRICSSFAAFLSLEMLAELRSIANTVSLHITPFGTTDFCTTLISESRAEELIEKFSPMKRDDPVFEWRG